MANPEHLAILKQGVVVWNKWRSENQEIIPDLRGAIITEELGRLSYIKTILRESGITSVEEESGDMAWGIIGISTIQAPEINLSNANLSKALIYSADLRSANLQGANLEEATISSVDLSATNLSQAKLQGATLSVIDLSEADLSNANLINSELYNVKLSNTNVLKANFTNSLCSNVIFSNVDLSVLEGLATIEHKAPSTVGIDTLYKSGGNIPREFLEGCGVPETMITFAKSLVGKPIEYYSCFISYSKKDEEFAHQLNDRMKREGLRVWFAPEEMKGGQKIHEQLYEAIRYHDKLILVLSEASMNSNWVQSEIRRARKHEREDKRRKLFPISLVPFGDIQKWELFEADEGVDLAREIREYYIPDFCQWKDYDKFNAEFEKLLKALRAED